MTNPERPEYPPDTLGLTAEEMRRLEYLVVDLTVDRLSRRSEEPALLAGSAGDLRAALGGPVPTEPRDVEAALVRLATVALAHQHHGDHPRYFARVPGPSSFAGASASGWRPASTRSQPPGPAGPAPRRSNSS